jgi:hypothetical protein
LKRDEGNFALPVLTARLRLADRPAEKRPRWPPETP